MLGVLGPVVLRTGNPQESQREDQHELGDGVDEMKNSVVVDSCSVYPHVPPRAPRQSEMHSGTSWKMAGPRKRRYALITGSLLRPTGHGTVALAGISRPGHWL